MNVQLPSITHADSASPGAGWPGTRADRLKPHGDPHARLARQPRQPGMLISAGSSLVTAKLAAPRVHAREAYSP